MKRIFIIAILFIPILWNTILPAPALRSIIEKNDSISLLIIDIQQFYFEGKGKLEGCLEASEVAKKMLMAFREKHLPVIHVMHGTQSSIHPNVAPIQGEKVIVKNEVNCFRGTELLEYLRQNHIRKLIICGMMTHMCLEAGTRAAADYGFACSVIHDACATRDLKFGNELVKAHDVQISTLASLAYYARVMSAEEFLKEFQ